MTPHLPKPIPHCDTTRYCKACRTRKRGRTFREGVLKHQNIEGVQTDFECPKKKPWIEDSSVELTVSAQAKNAAINTTKAIGSVVKTQILRRDRVSDKVYAERLNTCTNCPGSHAVFKNGALFTCGEFKNSITGKLPTFGCVLTKKARDASQDCPMGYWQKLTVDGKPVENDAK